AHGAALSRSSWGAGLFAAIQVEEHDLMAEIRVARDRATAAVLRVAGMASGDDDLELAVRARGQRLREGLGGGAGGERARYEPSARNPMHSLILGYFSMFFRPIRKLGARS